jgi:hypothetical protein
VSVAKQPLRALDTRLDTTLVERFAHRVLVRAGLPLARDDDLRASAEYSLDDEADLLSLTCTITGSTYEQPWDGSEVAAVSFTEEAADDTADLITQTRHYAWLRSRR